MKKHFQYLWYVIRHKWYVFVECCKLGIPWRGIVHDLSKFRRDEWTPYVRNFYGTYLKASEIWKRLPSYTGPTKESVKRDFDLAWLYHQKRSKHHWQYWLFVEDSPDRRWTIQQHSIENPLHLTLNDERLLTCTAENDDAIHTKAVCTLSRIVDRLNVFYPLPMPDVYRREMLADWRGAGRAITGKDNTKKWYTERREIFKIVLHDETRQWIEEQL